MPNRCSQWPTTVKSLAREGPGGGIDAGELAEIRASDLAFSTAEAGLLLARHGSTLTAGQLECLIRRTGGWAAGLRLAAVCLDAHPDPDQFLKELATEGSALTA